VNAPHRRNACPGLSTPMPTGDGLLVRFQPAKAIPFEAFTSLCNAAREHGNGTIEVTARGSVQVRGLTPRSAPMFANEIAALQIAADGVPVITDPLAGESGSKFNVTALAANLRRAIADARLTLAPKVSLMVDGGDSLHLDALTTDVRLRAIGSAEEPRIHISVGGDAASATPLGSTTPDATTDIVVLLLQVIAASSTGRAAGLLRSEGIDAFRSVIAGRVEPAPILPPRPPAEPVGCHLLRDGELPLGVALAFGHAHADALAELGDFAAAHGARYVRPAPGRALLLISLSEATADAVAKAAERLGFVVRADDPRRRVVACPGLPACASGLIPARALAADIAWQLQPGHDGIAVHVSGCAKGCAHPTPCALTVVGTVQGCSIIRNASARGTPRSHVKPAELVGEIARLADEEFAHG
jgi:precorrin-3B synthase